MDLKPARTPFARSRVLALLGVAVAAAGLGLAPAVADDAAYVGTWVVELRNCGAPASDPNSPMEMSKDGYDQHLTHCSFRSVVPRDGDFNISAECSSVDGNVRASEIVLTVSGNTLTFTDETGSRDLLRCR